MHTPQIAVVILAFLLFSFLLLELVLKRIREAIRLANQQVLEIEAQLSQHRDYSTYLPRKRRVVFRQRLDSLLQSFQRLRSYHLLMNQLQRESVDTSREKANKLISFLDEFPAEYTKKEVERHQDFFAGKVFDNDQLEAIVKRDVHHLVVAAAGSGKTRTLTARTCSVWLFFPLIHQSLLLSACRSKDRPFSENETIKAKTRTAPEGSSPGSLSIRHYTGSR